LKRQTWWRLGTVATSIAAACQFTPGRAPPDGPPVDGTPDAGICSSLSKECVGDVLRYCAMVNAPPIDESCGWGCVSTPMPHCAAVTPSGSGGVEANGVLPSDVADDELRLGAVNLNNVTFDSDNGRIGTPMTPNLHHSATPGFENGIEFQFRGPISMWRFRSVTITGTITLIGRRPVAIVAHGPISIAGVIVATGPCPTILPGPGGFEGGSNEGEAGDAPATTPLAGGRGAPSNASGGGGGGHGSLGGAGLNAAGGTAFGDPAIVLVGGAGGGAGFNGGNYGRGGGGGGALQIISNTKIEIAGGINAGGCGGKAGTGNSDSGGGGGAGGAILLEAPSVIVTGILAANGGGGGGGGGGGATIGANGSLGTMPAPAGAGNNAGEQGGAGAATGQAAGSGGNAGTPGGGGGGMGRIRINTRNGTGHNTGSATLSPGQADTLLFVTGSATTK
jgi:hypothetical protein